MRAMRRMWSYTKAFSQTKRNRTDFFGWMIRRPLLLIANIWYETAALFSNRVDPHYKELALLKAAGMVSCEFCLDIGSTLARTSGITEAQMRDLPRYADSDAYTDDEKLVIAFAEAVTATPAVEERLTSLRTELLEHFTKGQIAELAAEIAWENHRARLNQALGVRPTGMSDGAVCAMPEIPAA
ncbi:MAG: carboxymuconolactone decarboxylase family protein [Gordonia sp. (in: high G+C Gram-positive bacteria)]|uniref:carboxymuconolactone decarboxylase family protein n=1 Tax=Gordonia sp. (in: high G+C Gram-positive bacteria) TaxID=84139 RepID=UPI0039E5457C